MIDLPQKKSGRRYKCFGQSGFIWNRPCSRLQSFAVTLTLYLRPPRERPPPVRVPTPERTFALAAGRL